MLSSQLAHIDFLDEQVAQCAPPQIERPTEESKATTSSVTRPTVSLLRRPATDFDGQRRFERRSAHRLFAFAQRAPGRFLAPTDALPRSSLSRWAWKCSASQQDIRLLGGHLSWGTTRALANR